MLLGWTINITLVLSVRLKIHTPYDCNELDTPDFTNPGNDKTNKAFVFILELAP